MSENTSIVMNTEKSSRDRHLGMDRRGAKRSHFKRDESNSGSSTRSSRSLGSRERNDRNKELETDALILQRRQKQIDYGKNSVAYDTYIEKVPKASRPTFLPRTPDKYVKYSRRQWDGLIKAWKLQIHAWNARNDFSIGEWESVTTGNDVTKEEDEIKKEDLNEVKEDGEDEEEDLKEPVTKFNWCDEIEEEEEELLKRRKT